eukprot:5758494-Prymnesium_polylepis.1
MIGGRSTPGCVCTKGNRHAGSDQKLLQRPASHAERSKRTTLFKAPVPRGGASGAAREAGPPETAGPSGGADPSGGEGKPEKMQQRRRGTAITGAAMRGTWRTA